MAGPTISGFSIPGSVAARALAQVQFDLSAGAAPYANVFDPSIVQVDATVTSPAGVVTTQPCFWMQPGTAVTPTAGHGETYTLGTAHWFLRYKFPTPGIWTFTTTATDAGGQTVSALQSITVTGQTSSLSPWRLANKWYLTLDDGTWLNLIGENVGIADRDYTLDGTVGFAKYLAYVGSNGGTTARFVLSAYDRNGPEYIGSAAQYGGFNNYGLGLGQYAQQNCFRIDEFLRLAGANGVSVLFAYNTQAEWSTAAHWADSPYNSAHGGMIAPADPAAFLTNAGALKYQQMKARYMIARWAPYPSFGAIEHMDEGGSVGTGLWAGQNTIANHAAWVGTMGAYIRALDPWDHLLTWSNESQTVGRTDPIFGQSTIDFATLHAYQTSPWTVNDWPATTSAIIRAAQLRLGKPMLHTAAGLYPFATPPEPNFDPTTSALTQVQKDHLAAGTHVRANALAGIASGFTGGWPWWHGSYLAEDAAKHRVSGTIPIVSGGGGTTPSDLQAAINATPSGGTLTIAGGSYTGGFSINRPITLVLNGTALHMPAGSGTQVCMSINSSGVTITGTWTMDGSGNNQSYGSGIWAQSCDSLSLSGFRITNFVYGAVEILDSHGVMVQSGYIGQIGVGQAQDTNAYGVAFTTGGSGYTSGTAQDLVIEDIPTWQGMNAHNAQDILWQRITVRRTRRAFWIFPNTQSFDNNCQVLNCRAESPLPVTYDPTGYFVGQLSNSTFNGNFLSVDYPHPGDGGEWKAGIRDYGSASTNLTRTNTTVG